MKRTIAILTLLLAVLSTYHTAQAGLSYEGKVINVVQDEEGANVVMDVNGSVKTIYIPRSNSNAGITENALDALRTKRTIRLSR